MTSTKIETDLKKIECDGVKLIPPYTVEDHLNTNKRLIVLLGSWRNSLIDGHDFTLPSQMRNVVAINGSCEYIWAIESSPPETAEGYHKSLWRVQDRHLTIHDRANFEFDIETGSITSSWSKNELPIGETVVHLSGEVTAIIEYNGAIFVNCAQAKHDLYAFEATGEERWRSDPGMRRADRLFVEDGVLWESVAENRTTDIHYRIDYETGERLEAREVDTGYW